MIGDIAEENIVGQTCDRRFLVTRTCYVVLEEGCYRLKRRGCIRTTRQTQVWLNACLRMRREHLQCGPLLRRIALKWWSTKIPGGKGQNKEKSQERCISGLQFANITLFHYALSETGQTESSIKVPKQRTYTDRRPVIPSSVASISCAGLGTTKLLDRLNATLGTSYTLDTPSLSSHLEWLRLRSRIRATPTPPTMKRDVGNGTRRQADPHPGVCGICAVIAVDHPPGPMGDIACWDGCDEAQTPINEYEYASLELTRIEMSDLGAEYAWVGCALLETGPGEDEWKPVVPTIGHVYRQNQMVVYYYSGLGRPLSLEMGDLDSRRRCWFNRAWWLQEISEVGGDTDDGPLRLKAVPIDREEDEVVLRFHKQLSSLTNIAQHMRRRASEGAIDKIAGMAFLLRYLLIPRRRRDTFFLYPAPGNGNRTQIQNMELPATGGICLYEEVTRLEAMDADWHDGFCNEKGGWLWKARKGLLDDGRCDTGRTRTCKIVATHQHPIPEDSYTLISGALTEMDGGRKSWEVVENRSVDYFV
ncbi:hypothetical protein IW261DRAFT_1425420 [Armillaria novae-zelandiae]|uniref:Heterokaryon incompatibility domain-containing protein n=1 Tax=Armillaria novae-zelandiae TaxID=153914 RepID=A0AA39NSR5_9AGAR|nr:hypothetical protein IW261DRAFT_1425420 [Armillaria novae-zelandiae]